jgi:hypothetical protein
MDHHVIDDQNVAERYVLGQLSDDDRASFELHYIQCPECVARVHAVEGVRRGLRQIALETASTRTELAQGFLAWWSRASWRQRFAPLAAMLLIVALPALFLSLQLRSTERDLERAQLASSSFQQRQQEAQARLKALESQLRSVVGSEPLVFRLEISRGAGATEERRLKLPDAERQIVVVIDMGRVGETETFRAAIKDLTGAVKWQSGPLKQDSEEGLAIGFPSTVLVPGHYVVQLEEQSNGRYSRRAALPFFAVRQ